MDEHEREIPAEKKSLNNSTAEAPILVFSTTDPLGNTVQLKTSTWNMHVLDGDHYRPEFIGQEEVIKRVIEDPQFIIPDVKENRQRYYGLVHLTTNNKIKPVKVVVDHSTSPSDICTVFQCQR